ncbi:MAG: nucleotide exchange factor GrpE [Campylobacterales bacterium]|nr:nucleotide exchange factor GrpE [Campylobacterales bacterium]
MANKEEIQTEELTPNEEVQSQEETVQENTVVNEEEKFASLDEEFKTKMQSLVDQAEAKAKEAEDKYLRTHADFENIKKRMEKEKYQAIDYASEKFAKDLLSTIDTMEMALQSANADVPAEELIEKLKEGIELTIKNFRSTFEKHDISEVETDEFDPEVHNAVMKADSADHESGQIVQVLQKGYKYKERLLRPAMVSIAN